MMNDDRFSHLETQPLPVSVQTAISRLDRFVSLELAHVQGAPIPTPPPVAETKAARILCPHCHQSNESDRHFCWACFYSLKAEVSAKTKPAPDQEIELLLDGVSYRSSDPALSDDVKVLMQHIRAQGFSQQLLVDWKRWKDSKQPAPPSPTPASTEQLFHAADPEVQAFRGARVSVLRLDGKVYKSDDVDLPPDIKEILDYIGRDGVTPALMQHLRLYGTKVKFRPVSAIYPSDGDVDFWSTAKKHLAKGF